MGPIRYLQPQAWLGLPHAWGLPATPRDWDKVHGTEYQPNNIKRKHKHHWTGVGARIPASREHTFWSPGSMHSGVQGAHVPESQEHAFWSLGSTHSRVPGVPIPESWEHAFWSPGSMHSGVQSSFTARTKAISH